MRKAVFTMVGVLGFTVVFAQQEELKSAAANIESKNYIAALDNISKAKKKVNDLMTAQLASVLPQKFGEYEMAKDSDMGYGMEGQGVTMNKVYRKPKPKVEGSENGDEMMDMGMGENYYSKAKMDPYLAKIDALEERVRVLERIATDKGHALAEEINRL